jgi:hypothetical protein
VIRFEKYANSPVGDVQTGCDEPGCGAKGPRCGVSGPDDRWGTALAVAAAQREGWQERYKPLSLTQVLRQDFCPTHVKPCCPRCQRLEADCRCRCTICSLGDCSCPSGKSRVQPRPVE